MSGPAMTAIVWLFRFAALLLTGYRILGTSLAGGTALSLEYVPAYGLIGLLLLSLTRSTRCLIVFLRGACAVAALAAITAELTIFEAYRPYWEGRVLETVVGLGLFAMPWVRTSSRLR